MKSTDKLVTWLATLDRSPEVPSGLARLIKTVLAVQPRALRQLAAADPDEIDEAMLKVAELALSFRSDDAQALVIAPARAVVP